MNRRRRRSGFTLIEVLLVLLILGMLAALAIVGLTGTRESARIDATKLMLKTVADALEIYNMHLGHYPTEEEGGLNALLRKPSFSEEAQGEKWRGPYLREEPRDQWQNLLNYELAAADSSETPGTPYRLWSNGPDGQSGTEDDIRNWKEDAGGAG